MDVSELDTIIWCFKQDRLNDGSWYRFVATDLMREWSEEYDYAFVG